MKNHALKIVLILTVLILAGLTFLNRFPAEIPSVNTAKDSNQPSPAIIVKSRPETPMPFRSEADLAEASSNVKDQPPVVVVPPAPLSNRDKTSALPTRVHKPAAKDPDARIALSYVGLDRSAEDYWVDAINDLSLPAEERKDLIEDLNEDGLVNPKLATDEDLPIIRNRILLLEELASYTTDPVNLAAMDEAYKDLINLYNGKPAD